MSTLPNFQMDVQGEYTGNPYPEMHEYRITISGNADDGFVLKVEDHDGSHVGEGTFGFDEAEGIQRMAHTMHDIDVYEDDWTFPQGMSRVLTWQLPTDGENLVVLSESHIDTVASWLDYALGLAEYDGPEDRWEY